MGKYIIKVNGVEYHSYTDFCKDFNIDYTEFMKYKHENPSQLYLHIQACGLYNGFIDAIE